MLQYVAIVVFEARRLSTIQEADLQTLLRERVPESISLDYKRELPGGSDQERRAFLEDVAAFAMVGGHVLYGFEETGGTPTAISGLTGIDADDVMLRLRQMADANIAPRVPGLEFHSIPISAGGVVIAMRVPRSFVGPHMITFQGLQRFVGRRGAANFRLDVDDIRAAFAGNETLAARLRAFRADRLGRILIRDTPSPLPDTPVLVLHIFPLSTPELGIPIDLNIVFDQHWSLWPLGSSGGLDRRYNFDGVLLAVREWSYLQLFRNGALEAAVGVHASKSPAVVYADRYETMLIDELPAHLAGLARLGVQPPVFLALSLVGVKGWVIGSGAGGFSWPGEAAVDRDILALPEILLESLGLVSLELAQQLHSIFAIAWNASGRPNSPNYNTVGVWAPPGRR